MRREVFELCLVPSLAALLPRLESVTSLPAFQRRLLACSVPAGAPERRLVTASSLAVSLGISEAAAAALLDVLDCAAPTPHPLSAAAESACIHNVLLLLFVNTFTKPHAQSSLRVTGDAWPETGPPSSPSKRRSHAVAGAGLEDESLQHAFVMRHLVRSFCFCRDLWSDCPDRCPQATLLPLLRTTPAAGASVDVHLSAAEFDRLGFLFAVLGPPGTRLSEVAPAFAGGVQKSISISVARDWLSACCAPPLPPGAPPRDGDYLLDGAHRTTVLLRETDVQPGGSVRLCDCSDVTLYLLAPVGVVSLLGCSDCTLVLGGVGRCLRMEGCVRCNVTVAARCVQLRGVAGGVLHMALGRPLLVLGDTRGVRVAPFATHYDALERHLAAAGLNAAHLASGGAWERSQSLGCAGASALTPLPPAELLPLVIPFSAVAGGGAEAKPTRANPFPLPPPYAAALEAKTARVAAVQAAVQEAQLGERAGELHAAIQSHFQEWLLREQKMRCVQELSRIQA